VGVEEREREKKRKMASALMRLVQRSGLGRGPSLAASYARRLDGGFVALARKNFNEISRRFYETDSEKYSNEYDVCVIGCGPGGFATAMRAWDYGKKVRGFLGTEKHDGLIGFGYRCVWSRKEDLAAQAFIMVP